MFASKAIGIAFIVALGSLCVPAQTQPPATATPEASASPRTGSVTGLVLDENGQPVPNAVIQIRPINSNTAQTVTTDREGRFQVNDLEPLDYGVSVWKPAYLTGSLKLSRPGNTIRIGDSVAVTLIKGGVVTGRVTTANGDPVVSVTVRAQMVRGPDGRPTGGFAEERPTDDRGVYRIYGLREGTYVVSAGGPNVRTPTENVFEFDVVTYAPGSTRETAAEIKVGHGEEVSDIDIRYRAEQGRLISGDVTVPAATHAGFAVMLITGADAGFQYGQTFLPSENKRSFVFKGVAEGDYSLIAQSYSPEGDMAISELKQVSVQGADVTGVQLTTKLLGAVSGRVILDETKFAECNSKEQPLTTETSVFARFRDDEAAKQVPQAIRSRSEPARPDEKGNFLLRNLAPGAYSFAPTLRARQWYVQSIAFAAPATTAATKTKQVDATRVWTNIKTGDRLSGLTITLAQGGASLRGEYVLPPGERAPAGSVLYLVPAEREQATDVLRFFATSIERNGYFELTNVAPGRYWLLAQLGGADSAKVRLPQESETRAQLRRAAEAAKTEIELKPCQEISNFRLPLKP